MMINLLDGVHTFPLPKLKAKNNDFRRIEIWAVMPNGEEKFICNGAGDSTSSKAERIVRQALKLVSNYHDDEEKRAAVILAAYALRIPSIAEIIAD